MCNLIPDWKTKNIMLPKLNREFYEDGKDIKNIKKLSLDILHYLVDTNVREVSLLPKYPTVWIRNYFPILGKNNTLYFFTPDLSYMSPEEIELYNNFRDIFEDSFFKKYKYVFVGSDNNYPFHSLTLDGGNFVYSDDTIIVSERVLSQNRLKAKELKELFKHYFKVDNVLILRTDEDNKMGHVNSFVRFINNNTVMLNKSSHGNEDNFKYNSRVLKAAGKKLFIVPYDRMWEDEEGWVSDTNNLMNYLCTENTIVFPNRRNWPKGLKEELIRNFSEYKNIYFMNCNVIQKYSSGLHSISWNY